jgi:hypothetical protein
VRRLVLFAAVVCAGLVALTGSALGSARLYTPDYTNDLIGGFELGTNGSLTALPASPFAADASSAGTGGIVGFGFTPEGQRAASSYLFSGGAQGESLNAAGILAPAGAAIASASATGLAVTPDGRFAFAPTREFGSPAEGIVRYAITADGSLSRIEPPGGSGEYGDIAITPDGRFLFAAYFGRIERFAIGADGSLGYLGFTPAPTAEWMTVSPDGRFLFLVPGGGGELLAAFTIDSGGGLTAAGPPVALPGSSPQIPTVAPDSHRLYLPDYNFDRIFTFAIADSGVPALVGETPIENPESAAVSPDGRYLIYYRGGGSESALGVATLGSDGVPTLAGVETPWSSGEPERIVFQPQPAPVAKFTVRTAPPGRLMQFDARASTNAARYDWDFGDGTALADGGPVPIHTYAKAGEYHVTLTVTDPQGCSTRQVYTGQSTVCPGGGAAVTSAVADTLPLLVGRPKAVPKKFVPRPWGVKVKGKFGTTFHYRVSEVARVRFKIERLLRKKKCGPLTARCKRVIRVGSRAQRAKAGLNRLRFNGDLKRKPLTPGSYRATVVATDKAGGRSDPKTVGFRVLATR